MTHAHIVLGGPVNDVVTVPTVKKDTENVFIGVDKGALYLLKHQIIPDLAIGDFDSISLEEKTDVEKHARRFRTFPSDKEDTDTELALVHTIEEFSPDTLTLYHWSGGRMDHLLSILFLVFQPRFHEYVPKIHLKNEENSIRFYFPGSYSIQKEKDKSYLSYIGLTEIQGLTLKNVKYPLEKADYAYPTALVSNEFIGEEAEFSFEKGVLAVIQTRD